MLAVFIVSAFGWLGPRAEAMGGLPGSNRNREAWRPSPIAGNWEAPVAERYTGEPAPPASSGGSAATPTPGGPGGSTPTTAAGAAGLTRTPAASPTPPQGATPTGAANQGATATAAAAATTAARTPASGGATATGVPANTATRAPATATQAAQPAQGAQNTPAPAGAGGATATSVPPTATAAPATNTPVREAPPAPAATTAPSATPGTAPVSSADGAWREVRFESKALGREMPYLVWLPPGYPASGTRYPVLYLLHGGGDGVNPNRTEWRQLGLGDVLAKRTESGEFPRSIVVLPEGLQGFWINHANNGPRWADFVTEDLVAHVDKTFQTDARPEKRAIGGLSMGGHGALQLALTHPNLFRIVGAHSPALRTYEESPEFFGSKEWYARWDPLTIAKGLKSEDARRFIILMDTGEKDRWRPSANELARVLDSRGTKVDLRVLSGGHDGNYWKSHLQEYIDFYGAAFRQW